MTDETKTLCMFVLCNLLLVAARAFDSYLKQAPLPKKEPEMKIDEALEMMDKAVAEGHLYGVKSEVYPGLTAIQAVRFILEGFLPSIPNKLDDRARMAVHPRVAIRIRQVCSNRVLYGEPPADKTVAALYFLSHPEDLANTTEESAQTTESEQPQQTGKRKFL